MNGAIAWFARNHVASNLLMATLVFGGLLTLPRLAQRVFPEVSLDVVRIDVAYPGASPREVEESICVRIEEALQGLQGIKRIRSFANEGLASTSVELRIGEDVRRRMDEIRGRIDRIRALPEAAEEPVVTQADIRIPVIDLAVAGDVDEWSLKRFAERMRDDLIALPELSEVELVATRDYEIAIEVSEEALLRHDLRFDDVVAAVRRSSVDLAGGTLHTSSGEILLRTTGQARQRSDFESIVLLSRSDGSELRLGDVATVVDGFADSERSSRFDGRPAALLRVYRVGAQSALEVSRAVHEYAQRANAMLPDGVEVIPWRDEAQFLRDRLSTVVRNAQSGFVLVVCVLALFLRLRLALWVSLGIPLSFLGAIWWLPAFDVGIDLISLTAFILVLGIVVDDAIIVGESVHTEQERLPAPPDASREQIRAARLDAAIRGVRRVSVPVIFGVLTTIVAFAPILAVPGPMGRIARIIPIVVILCLAFSLIESLLVLPAHLAHAGSDARPPRRAIPRAWRRFQQRIAHGLDAFVAHGYRRALDAVIEWRGVAAAAALAVFAVAVATLAGGWLRFTFQPQVEGTAMVAYLTMPTGTPAERTREAVERLARAANSVRERVASEGAHPRVFAHVQTTVGAQPFRGRQASGPAAFMAAGGSGGHLGEVVIEVVPEQQRDITAAALVRRWRAAAGEIAGASELGFTATLISAGSPIHLELQGRDLEQLRAAAAWLRRELALLPGVIDVRDSLRAGKPELSIALRPGAEALGVHTTDLARQVRQAFYGEEAQRLQRGRDDVRVVVRYPVEERRSLAALDAMRVRGANGVVLPFAAVAQADPREGYASIERIDRQRVVTVKADVDASRANANEIVSRLRERTIPDLRASFPHLAVDFGGEQREQSDFLRELGRGWALALLAIYGLLAIPLRSYLQPLIIMAAIPFGVVGAEIGHLLCGYDFSMYSVIGVVALSGVVVNDSLVLVDRINQLRARGASVHEAVRTAARSRFRAILLTSLTTFAGLLPLLGESSPQAQLLVPLAISLGFGVLFATAITLLLVPVVYCLLDDLGAAGRARPAVATAAPGRSAAPCP